MKWILGTILAWSFAVAATPPDLEFKARILRHLLQDLDGVTVSTEGGQVVVDGTVLSTPEMDRVVRVVDAYPGTLNLVTLHPVIPISRAQVMEKAIRQELGYEGVTVEALRESFVLRGLVDSEAQREHAQSIVETYAPDRMVHESVKQGVLSEPPKKILNLIRVRKQ